jgi:hypothetical protein
MDMKNRNENADRAERLLIYFSTAQRRALQAAAKRCDTSQAALIRRGLDLVIAETRKAKRGAK